MTQLEILEWALFGVERKLDYFLRNEQRDVLFGQKAELIRLITIEKEMEDK